MSEEKKAIEIIKEYYQDFAIEHKYPYLRESIDIILELIEKQQKEIEELTEAIEEWVNGERINDIKHISKDKIRAKIKELEQIQNTALTGTTIEIMDYKITILKQLLEE